MTDRRDEIRRAVEAAVDAHLERPETEPSTGSRFDDDPSYRGRALVTESDVMEAHRLGRPLVVPAGALMTPLARDAVERFGVDVVEGTDNSTSVDRVRQHAAPVATRQTGPSPERVCDRGAVAVASDHGGFEMKQLLIRFLEEEAGIPCVDLGAHDAQPVDYPDFARKVADEVAAGRVCRGIVVDGAGIGSAMAANKVRGIRAAHCSNVVEARNSREHNDANVLSLGGRVLGPELAKAIAIVFMKTDFGGGRHQKRVDKIMELER